MAVKNVIPTDDIGYGQEAHYMMIYMSVIMDVS